MQLLQKKNVYHKNKQFQLYNKKYYMLLSLNLMWKLSMFMNKDEVIPVLVIQFNNKIEIG